MIRTKFNSQKQVIDIVKNLQLENPNYEKEFYDSEIVGFLELSYNDQKIYASELLLCAKTYKWNWSDKNYPTDLKFF